MSADSPSPVERRRIQNRIAQRKRRDTVKNQLQQLQVRNAELLAFKESMERGAKLDSDFPNSARPITPTCCVRLSPGYDFARRPSWGNGELESGELTASQRTNSYSLTPGPNDEYLCQVTNVQSGIGNLVPSHVIQTQFQPHGEGNQEASVLSTWNGSDHTPKATDTTLQQVFSFAKSATRNDFSSQALDEVSISSMGPGSCFGSVASVNCPKHDKSPPSRRCKSGERSSSSKSRASSCGEPQEALRLAIANGHVSMARLLIKHGADVNFRDENGRAVLLYAIEAEDAEMVELLLENEADVNNIDNSGMSALHIAASLGHVDVAEVLLRLE